MLAKVANVREPVELSEVWLLLLIKTNVSDMSETGGFYMNELVFLISSVL